MSSCNKIVNLVFPFVVLILLHGCAALPPQRNAQTLTAYTSDGQGSGIDPTPPVFIIENPREPANRIGTPSARINGAGEEEVRVSPDVPTIYTEKRNFQTARDSYTNLIYRIHFPETPFSLVPFYLGWGKNIGVLVVVTVNSKGLPVLYTTVQTCGCYLALVPTSYTPEEALPGNWQPRRRQAVYGETLPGLLDFGQTPPAQARILIFLRSGTHRVKGIRVATPDAFKGFTPTRAELRPLSTLEAIPLPGGNNTTSFYETSGYQTGYVKDSGKPWERLLMSWWALDWRIGQDKKLGADRADGTVFYTSLKPWARDDSDLRDFPAFLQYWGWNL